MKQKSCSPCIFKSFQGFYALPTTKKKDTKNKERNKQTRIFQAGVTLSKLFYSFGLKAPICFATVGILLFQYEIFPFPLPQYHSNKLMFVY